MKKSNRNLILALVPTLLAFIFVFPRILISTLGESNPWTSYLYMYVFGGVFFTLGVILALRTGACVPGRGRDSFYLKFLIGGFVFFASLHAFWIYLSLSIVYKGA